MTQSAAEKKPEPAAAEAAAPSAAEPAASPPSWRAMWPLPAMLLGGCVLVGGIVVGIMTRPKVDVRSPLKEARELHEAGKAEEALGLLNGDALAVVNSADASEHDIQEFFLLRARALADAQTTLGVNHKENHEAIVRDFESAEKHGAVLATPDVRTMCASLLSSDRVDAALERARALPTEDPARWQLLKKVVEQRLSGHDERFDDTMGILAEFAREPNLPPEEAAWTLARQAELYLASGHAEDAIGKLLRDMQLIRELSARDRGELHHLLGRGYLATGDLNEAAKHLERATELVDVSDPLQAEILVNLASIRQAGGQLDEAKEKFAAVVGRYANSRSFLPAALGLASVQALLGEDEDALEWYATAVERVRAEPHRRDVTKENVTRALMARHSDRLGAGKMKEALRYALLAESLHLRDEVPTEVLLALGTTFRRQGDGQWGRGEGSGATGEPDTSGAQVDLATQKEAKLNYISAGEYYERHARAAVVTDAEAASRSWFASADSYDLAGDTENAIKGFSLFSQGASDDDPRKPEAKFRLAQAFQATRDYGTAASLYLELVDARREDDRSRSVLWGERSVVPLAQCYLLDAEAGNDEEAEQLLVGMVSGRELDPEAVEYRGALLELGKLYYEKGRYAEAIERLEEMQQRFPKDKGIDGVRYRLADSNRLAAEAIQKALKETMPQAERHELEEAREARLREAMKLFRSVKASLGSRLGGKLSALERVYLRNSTFAIGDCAYDLEEYGTAIAAYDAAREDYASDPSSLVAMVQIVNAYVEQGEWAKAVTANQRALLHLQRFPDDAWAKGNLPMEKKHWARWLDSRTLLEQRAAAEGKP